MPEFFNDSPFAVTFIGLSVVLYISYEAGFFLGSLPEKKGRKVQTGNIGALVGAMAGLLAFLLAFTFGAVGNRLDTRKQLLVDEANAIGTAWVRAGLIPPVHAEPTRGQLRRYVDVRISGVEGGDLQSAIRESESILDSLGATTVALVREEMDSELRSLFVASVSEIGALHRSRIMYGIVYRLPGVLWVMLGGLSILALLVIGYQARIEGTPRTFVTPACAASFALVVSLIADLDRAQPHGAVRVSQQALKDVSAMMARTADTGR